MEDVDYKKFAKEFIANWQENFAKTMQDPEIMISLSQAMSFMQQFYNEKSFTFAANVPPQSGVDELYRKQLEHRICELEERIAELESKPKNSGRGKRRPK